MKIKKKVFFVLKFVGNLRLLIAHLYDIHLSVIEAMEIVPFAKFIKRVGILTIFVWFFSWFLLFMQIFILPLSYNYNLDCDMLLLKAKALSNLEPLLMSNIGFKYDSMGFNEIEIARLLKVYSQYSGFLNSYTSHFLSHAPSVAQISGLNSSNLFLGVQLYDANGILLTPTTMESYTAVVNLTNMRNTCDSVMIKINALVKENEILAQKIFSELNALTTVHNRLLVVDISFLKLPLIWFKFLFIKQWLALFLLYSLSEICISYYYSYCEINSKFTLFY